MLYNNLESNKIALVYTMLMPLRQVVSNEDWTYIWEDYNQHYDLENMQVQIDAVAAVQDEHILVKFYFYFDDWGSENPMHRLLCKKSENLETDILAHLPFVLKHGIDIDFLLDYLEEGCMRYDNEDEYAHEYGYRYTYGYE